MVGLTIELINAITGTIKERDYLMKLNRAINDIPSKEENLVKVRKLLNTIIRNDITDIKEALNEIDDVFDSDITSAINVHPARYSNKHKVGLLRSLSKDKTLIILDQSLEEFTDAIHTLRSASGDKSINRATEDIVAISRKMNERVNALRVTEGSGKSMVIDPSNTEITNNSLSPIIVSTRNTNSTVIKTFPAFDQVTYGGLKLGSSTLVVGRSGGFKSGTLHNVLLAATINNDPSKFEVPEGRKPAVFYFSMENSIRQLYERHISYFCTPEEIANTRHMTTDVLAQYVGTVGIKNGMKIPIIYEDRNGLITTISDIAAKISEYEQMGYHPVLLGIDYLTKMTTDDPIYRNYSDTGADGTKKQQKKSEEIRNYLMEKNIAGVIPEQLSSDGVKAIESLRAYSGKIDPLFHTSVDMIANARLLSTEFENIVFVYLGSHRRENMDTNLVRIEKFVSMINKKSRDGGAEYILSPRDIINMPLYELQIRKLKGSNMRDFVKDTGEIHVVSPLEEYRISQTDYAKSIIMYYTNDNTDYMSLRDLMGTSAETLLNSQQNIDQHSGEDYGVEEYLGL